MAIFPYISFSSPRTTIYIPELLVAHFWECTAKTVLSYFYEHFWWLCITTTGSMYWCRWLSTYTFMCRSVNGLRTGLRDGPSYHVLNLWVCCLTMNQNTNKMEPSGIRSYKIKFEDESGMCIQDVRRFSWTDSSSFSTTSHVNSATIDGKPTTYGRPSSASSKPG